MSLSYYDRKEVSNSMLSALKHELEGREMPDNIQDIFDFGNLVDAMITEPDRIDYAASTMDGKPAKDFELALSMRNAFERNETCQAVINGADFQKVSVKNRSFQHRLNNHLFNFSLDCRCKWDFFNKHGISGDIKTTSATTRKQFIAACDHFDYFRSRAWYMDLEGTNKDLIIGISKVNMEIFLVPVNRGDDFYKQGVRQYTELAFKYYILKS